ncbi:MAG: hypothetical protein H7312_08635 [Tardiphaga sp.]|nr:hypothetical protein [Tardiphaga sp.]
MNANYVAALNGTLVSPTGGAALSSVEFYNDLPFTVQLFFIDGSGYHQYLGTIFANSNAPVSNVNVGDFFLFSLPTSGAFISVIELTSATGYHLDNTLLIDPNDIGPIPQPNQTVMVPPNSPRVLVACGTLPPTGPGETISSTSNYVTREQYWALQGDSYSIVPGETRTISFTVTSGKQETSSEQATVAASVGTSAGGGWGPVSASVSASLNMSASVFQQVTITEQTSTYVSDVVTNNSKVPILVLRWQMVDVLTIFTLTGTPMGTVSSGSVVIVQSYDLSGLASQVARPLSVRRSPPPKLGKSA